MKAVQWHMNPKKLHFYVENYPDCLHSIERDHQRSELANFWFSPPLTLNGDSTAILHFPNVIEPNGSNSDVCCIHQLSCILNSLLDTNKIYQSYRERLFQREENIIMI